MIQGNIYIKNILKFHREKIIKTSQQSEKELTYEIGSNSDLIFENTITENLPWTIETFTKKAKAY